MQLICFRQADYKKKFCNFFLMWFPTTISYVGAKKNCKHTWGNRTNTHIIQPPIEKAPRMHLSVKTGFISRVETSFPLYWVWRQFSQFLDSLASPARYWAAASRVTSLCSVYRGWPGCMPSTSVCDPCSYNKNGEE